MYYEVVPMSSSFSVKHDNHGINDLIWDFFPQWLTDSSPNLLGSFLITDSNNRLETTELARLVSSLTCETPGNDLSPTEVGTAFINHS